MEKGWFRNRLTPEKLKSTGWPALADAIETLVRDVVEPYLKRNDARKSLYTMAEEDLNLRISELGQFFNVRTRSPESKPLLLMQRLDEIHLKNTDQPIINTFWREFDNMTVTWVPIWAPVDQDLFPYGSVFLTQESVTLDRDTPVDEHYGELFLTSRGTILVRLDQVYQKYCVDGGIDLTTALTELLNDFALYIHPLVPKHIVFDGVAIMLYVDLIEDAEDIWLSFIESDLREPVTLQEREEHITLSVKTDLDNIPVQPGPPDHNDKIIRYDDIPADDWITDYWRAPDCYTGGIYFFTEPGAVHFEYTSENDGREQQYAVSDTSTDTLSVETLIEHLYDVSGNSVISGTQIQRFDVFPADETITDLGE
ncbi:hypothetical protein L6019_RS23690 [Escherichia coli]|nr:hypothetical protein [Escherichia coli]EKG7113556.1 hypothetical protein [Escherichia coli]EKR4920582.1 hypothetical protein [Escherichia coli]ELM8776632.1 hypothetical protein [Escherichia coli]EMA4402860.1 hypothetical protein [Escherichia coli]